jgi:hypothetical protein
VCNLNPELSVQQYGFTRPMASFKIPHAHKKRKTVSGLELVEEAVSFTPL